MSRQVSPVGRPSFSRPSRPSRPRKSYFPRSVRPGGRGWLKLIVLAVLVVAFWQYFSIEKIEIKQVEALDAKAIELAVRKGMKSQLLGENLVTLSAGRLEQSVTGEIPEIKNLEIQRKWPTVLVV